jgi:hypothetical protein
VFGRPAIKPRYARGIPESWWYDQERRRRYARELQADLLADELLLIVDGKLPVLTDEPNKDTAVRVSRDIARAKHRVWQAGRISPRKWGYLV